MADKRQKRAAEFIESFRVKPGSKVRLEKDFDPSFKAGVKKKKEGVALLATGVQLLTEYQARLAAQDNCGRAGRAAGARRRGQGRDDPPRDERRQPAGRLGAQLQAAVGRGARPRLSVALRTTSPGPRRDRDLQPLPLRGGARGAGAPGDPRSPEAAARSEAEGRLAAALPRDQRLGAVPDRERVPDREAVPEPLQGGAAHPVPAAGWTCPITTGSSRPRTSGSASAGTTTRRRSRRCSRTRARSGRRGT